MVSRGVTAKPHGKASGLPFHASLVDVAPAVYAFHTKHTSYAGLKLAPATGVAVVNASKATYCVETTGATPHVFKNGPTAHMMIGTCASPAAGTPISG